MSICVVRVAARKDGIFGVLLWFGEPICLTLEHAYSDGHGWVPKIPVGVYRCVRTKYHKGGYETFEVTGVQGHSRLLFHKGNTNADSEGCVLLGEEFAPWSDRTVSVKHSGAAFSEFMERSRGISEFEAIFLAA